MGAHGQTSAERIRTFDANNQPKPPWATFVPNAVGFRVHRNRAGAIVHFNNNDYALLFDVGPDGRWREVARKCREDEGGRCSICGCNTIVPEKQSAAARGGSYYWQRQVTRIHEQDALGNELVDEGRYTLERHNYKIIHPLKLHFACPNCYNRVT